MASAPDGPPDSSLKLGQGGRRAAQLHRTDALAAGQHPQGGNMHVHWPVRRQGGQRVRMGLPSDGLVQQAAPLDACPIAHLAPLGRRTVPPGECRQDRHRSIGHGFDGPGSRLQRLAFGASRDHGKTSCGTGAECLGDTGAGTFTPAARRRAGPAARNVARARLVQGVELPADKVHWTRRVARIRHRRPLAWPALQRPQGSHAGCRPDPRERSCPCRIPGSRCSRRPQPTRPW